jgi:hypothetical protein
MTKHEITGYRDLFFSGWIRKNLPDSNTGYMVTDLDFILSNYKTKKIMLLEIKSRNRMLPTWQAKLFKRIDSWIKKGIDQDWQYLGFHTIIFENTNFTDGRVFFDGKVVTEQELIQQLSF